MPFNKGIHFQGPILTNARTWRHPQGFLEGLPIDVALLDGPSSGYFEDGTGPFSTSTTANAAAWFTVLAGAGDGTLAPATTLSGVTRGNMNGAITVDAGTLATTGINVQHNSAMNLLSPSVVNANYAPIYLLGGRFAVENAGGNGFHFFGCMSVAATAAIPLTTAGASAITANSGYGFRIDASLNLNTVQAQGGTQQEVDSGVDIVNATWFDLLVVRVPSRGGALGSGTLLYYHRASTAATWTLLRTLTVTAGTQGRYRPTFAAINAAAGTADFHVDGFFHGTVGGRGATFAS